MQPHVAGEKQISHNGMADLHGITWSLDNKMFNIARYVFWQEDRQIGSTFSCKEDG